MKDFEYRGWQVKEKPETLSAYRYEARDGKCFLHSRYLDELLNMVDRTIQEPKDDLLATMRHKVNVFHDNITRIVMDRDTFEAYKRHTRVDKPDEGTTYMFKGIDIHVSERVVGMVFVGDCRSI